MCLPITTVGMFGAKTKMAKHAIIRLRLSRERTKSLTQGESPSLFETNRFTSGRTTIKGYQLREGPEGNQEVGLGNGSQVIY